MATGERSIRIPAMAATSASHGPATLIMAPVDHELGPDRTR